MAGNAKPFFFLLLDLVNLDSAGPILTVRKANEDLD